MSADARDAVLAAITAMMQANGLSIDDITATLSTGGATGLNGPTFGELLEQHLPRLTANTRRTYATSLDRLRYGAPPMCACECERCCNTELGCQCDCVACGRSQVVVLAGDERPLRAFTRSDIDNAVEVARRVAVKRGATENRSRAAKGRALKAAHGRGAQETAVRAYRWIFGLAVGDQLLDRNPADAVAAPRRRKSTRRGLTDAEIPVFFDAVASGGDDPELDVLLCWFHAETGARRDGGLNLRLCDLHSERQMIHLREKFGDEREQPVSEDLIAALIAHAAERGGPRCDPDAETYDSLSPVFHYRITAQGRNRPLTGRRYDTLFQRIQTTLPWADEIHLTAHGLRYTAGRLVERLAGTQVARMFLGHADRTVTDRYTEAAMPELAQVTTQLTGRPHPLAGAKP